MFYDQFRLLCSKKGVSCNRAAADMGLSNSTPTKWKKNASTPEGATLMKVADYFNVTLEYLQGLTLDSQIDTTEYRISELHKQLKKAKTDEEKLEIERGIDLLEESLKDLRFAMQFEKEKVPSSIVGSRDFDPIISRTIEILCQFPTETRVRCLEYLESLLALQNSAQASNTQG